ncbi:beta strand repeat-containing protein [Hyalangium minutum]|uniref:Lipoprotein n=1 Tax=Hyalangium minutum TaxID=394096 RepID=A0A085VZ60_9BACT|nr:MopE-related protein [Hyalangium minutum]KFE60723.1 hypothetical protein DB31_4636 [Hyalangium minutum]
MKKLSLLALVVILSACKGDTFDGEAIHAKVLLTPAVSATCVLFEVRDPASQAVLQKRWLNRAEGDNDLQVAIFRGALPETVELTARPFRDGTCQLEGEQGDKKPNGLAKAVTATFVKDAVPPVTEIPLEPGTDGDADGYVSTDAGGSDCQDQDRTVYPAAAETCSLQVDLNCNGKKGCEEAGCSPNSCLGDKLVFLSSARTATVRVCSQAVQFQIQDSLGNALPVSTPTTVGLQADSSTGLKFYSDSGCNTELTSGVTLAANASTGSFYFKGTQAGIVNVSLTASGFISAQQAATITAGPPTVMVFTGPGQGTATATAGECAGLVTVTLKDADGNTANATGATNISLTPNGGPLTFSTSPTCSPMTTTVLIPQGASSATFRYRSTQTGSFSIGGSFGGLTSTPLAVTVTPGAPTLVFNPNGQTVTAGNCSTLMTVQRQDSFNNSIPVTTATPVTLTANPSTGFQFYTDAACTMSVVTPINMPSGASTIGFYFKGTTAGTVAVTAGQGTLSVSQNVTINAAPPTVLAFSPASLTVAAGDCTALMLLATDIHGNRSNVSGNQSVTLAPGAGLSFSATSNCSGSTNAFTINSGQSSVNVYAKATSVGSVSATANRSGFTSGTLNLTVNPGAPARLAFTTNQQTLEINTCSAVTTVQVRDSSNNPSPVSSDTPVNLTASSGTVTFYLSADCTGPTTSLTIPSGQTSGNFYFKDTTAENVTITASNPNLASATQNQSITSPQPTALVFTTSPQTRMAGACSGVVTVQAQLGGNPAPVTADTPVSLTAAPPAGFTFYSTGNCSGSAVTQVTIGFGQSTANFTFKGNTAGTIALAASNPSIPTPATQSATITPAAPSKLAFSTPPLTTVAGTCSQAVTVQSRDDFDNPSLVNSDKTLSLSATGTPTDNNFKFYLDGGCTNELAGNSVLLANGQSSVTFYYRGQKVRNVDLSANTSGLTATPPQTHTITTAAVTKVVFTSTSPMQLLASTCAMRTIERQDAADNPVAGGASLNVALTGSAPVEFYLDSGCTQLTNQVTIAAGSSSVDFWFKGLSGGINTTAPLTLTATSAGLTAANQLENIIPTVRTSGATCTMTGTQTTANCPITPPLQDASRAFLVFQATTQNQTSELANVRCVLNTTSTPVDVQCSRAVGGGSNVNIRWFVAEFPTGVAVQHGSHGCGGPTTGLTISSVVMDHTFLLLSSEKDINNQRSTVPRLVDLKSSTQAEIRKTPGANCTPGNEVNSGQIVDYTAATVQRGLMGIGGGAATVDINLSPAVPLSQSIVLYSYVFESNTTKICDRLVRGELTSSGNKLTFSRGSGDTSPNCTTPQINEISYEVVTFPAGTVVQQVTRSLLAGGASTNVAITPVDPSRTIVIGGGQWASGQVHGESKFAGGESISEGRIQAYLMNGSILTLSRESTGDGATFTVYVVQLKP